MLYCWEWIGSDALKYEIEQNTDAERKERLLLLANTASETIGITEKVLAQAEKLKPLGFDEFDAVHLALAESAKIDIFLTTDDNLQKAAERNKSLLPFMVVNPVKWLEEVLK